MVKGIRTGLGLACCLACLLYGSEKVAGSSRLYLQHGKAVYISGETIPFKLSVRQDTPSPLDAVFVDLCSESAVLSSVVVKCSGPECSGWIEIPDTAQTGVYLLRAYIGDENGEMSITSNLLCLVNRFGNNDLNERRKHRSGSVAFHPFYVGESLQSPLLSVETDREVYGVNSPVVLSVKNQLPDEAGSLCLQVYLTDTVRTQNALSPIPPEPAGSREHPRLYPYLTLSGKLVPGENNLPVENQWMLLSRPDSVANIDMSLTDREGNFFFVLENEYGENEYIIQTADTSFPYSIEIHSANLAPPEVIPYYLPLSIEKSSYVHYSVQRAQINKAFEPAVETRAVQPVFSYPFYGIPDLQIDPSQYIPLTDFQEITKEIVPWIRYRLNGINSEIRVWDPSDRNYKSNPLVLVDGVPCFDIRHLNAFNSETIRRIEVVTGERTYGNLLIPGLVAIHTYAGDFSLVPLPRNAVNTTMRTFSPPNRSEEQTNSPLKDLLCWDPNWIVDIEREKVIQTSLETGVYIAVVSAFDRNGNYHQARTVFRVE
ncbi:MAG TPA: Plug domain-containing protein [Prolixibacteraceae bacterium]|nr:Plug domain-containing protein [Prolixibacteraceae bacterium]